MSKIQHMHFYSRIVMPLAFALFLLFSLASAALAAAPASRNAHSSSPTSSLNSSSKFYLALGDSLAFGFQPDLDFKHGYVDDLSKNLSTKEGFQPVANMGCNGETSTTMLNGKCPYPYLRKYPYKGAQFESALDYLHSHAGKVALVTLDMGANDTSGDIDLSTCKINKQQFQIDLATLDTNLTQTILPGLYAGLMVNGHLTGSIVMMNYYDPFQNICPDSVAFTQVLNQHLAHDVSAFGTIVDVFGPFGGPGVPNPKICKYTWMCGKVPDIHAANTGYRVIAEVFKDALPPNF